MLCYVHLGVILFVLFPCFTTKMIQKNKFKKINDSYGNTQNQVLLTYVRKFVITSYHPNKNEMLFQTCTVLVRTYRQSDSNLHILTITIVRYGTGSRVSATCFIKKIRRTIQYGITVQYGITLIIIQYF